MIHKEDPDMDPTKKSVLINETFMDRNDRFYNLLWKDLPTFGPSELPFDTTFCLGSGKHRSILGKTMDSDPWFNLRNQKFQLSVPTSKGKIAHDFEEAFQGGSCVSLEAQSAIRLFVCDFTCDNDLILIFAVKKESSETDVRFLLKIHDDSKKEQKIMICGFVKEGEDFLLGQELASTEELRKIHTSLPKSSNSLNLGRTSINDWTLR